MRERTTWNRTDIQKAASEMSKRAEDPRAMNQDHLQRQPPADKYLTGGPSEFAEDVHPSQNNWKVEYDGGQTSRNEVGLPEMRGDTFSHPETDPGSSPARGGGGRQASLDEETLVKKADQCCKVARRMLGSKAAEAAIEDQALALMNLSDSDLISTVNRLAAQEEEEDKDEQSKQAQDQQEQDDDKKQAGQIPPQFKEQIEKKKEEAKEKKEEKKAQDQGQQDQDQEQKQANQQQQMLAQQAIQAAQQGDAQALQSAVQQMVQQAASAVQGQTMGLEQQIQQMIQQAVQQGTPTPRAPDVTQSQQQEQQQQAQQHQQQQMEQQALDAMLQQQQAQQQPDDQMIDQMLAQDQQPQQQQANDFGIQLDSPSMDIGEVPMGPEDEVLSTLFANNQEVQQAQQAYVLQHGSPAPMQVQASPMTRTASTRTVGTRPTGGVSQLGGLGSPAPTTPGGGEVEKLANLWNSAPDVSDVFRT